MNTDNCSLGGLTIDYGPCAFMDVFSADKVFSSIDHGARYAYQNQPGIAQWNLANLAQCLLSFIDEDEKRSVEIAQEAINQFNEIFITHFAERMRAKLGLDDAQDDDLELISTLLDKMQTLKLDFTQTFTQLTHPDPSTPFAPGGGLHDWHLRWQQRLGEDTDRIQSARERMKSVNPAVIPRNHLVEEFIDLAVAESDFSAFNEMLEAVTEPFNPAHRDGEYAQAPQEGEEVTATFCGT